MGKEIKQMLIYYFDGDTPAIPAEENLIYEFFYDEKGRQTREVTPEETVEYFYEMGDGGLIREVHNYSNGRRIIKDYDYDRDFELVHCHSEEQEAYEGYGEYVFIPTGSYSDEWYDWSNDGKTCIRKKENHYADATTTREQIREEYNDLGWLRLIYHYDEDFHYNSLEARHYKYPDGELLHTIIRTVFTTKGGERRELHSKKSYAEGRIIHEEYNGTDEEGNEFENSILNEYKDNEEGDWIENRQFRNRTIVSTVLREIEYW